MIILPARPSELINDTKTIHNILLDSLKTLTIATSNFNGKDVMDGLASDYHFIDGFNQLYLIHYRSLPHITEILGDVAAVLTAKNRVLKLLQQ